MISANLITGKLKWPSVRRDERAVILIQCVFSVDFCLFFNNVHILRMLLSLQMLILATVFPIHLAEEGSNPVIAVRVQLHVQWVI